MKVKTHIPDQEEDSWCDPSNDIEVGDIDVEAEDWSDKEKDIEDLNSSMSSIGETPINRKRLHNSKTYKSKKLKKITGKNTVHCIQ